MENDFKDLPQLIVGLDSLDDSANYIHIEDVKGNVNYYCPCCKGLIKPRAYKKDENYQVQPHFYHVSGGCSEETYVHFICKTWLFEKGCKFIVNNIIYEVDNVEIEKTMHTSFGYYRPDIIVTTTNGKIFYFEIKVSNKKTDFYQPKWDELGNDVVEVDTRYFINQKCNNKIPEFNLIYSDGECFIKSYSKIDYEETIGKRKREWKRQDKLNYKIQWERLDWFWHLLNFYKNGEECIEEIIEAFKNLVFNDMDFVLSILNKIKCQNLYQYLIPVINKQFYKEIKEYDISPYKDVKLVQESPRIFYILFEICRINNCIWYNSCFVPKKIKYYGKELFDIFLNFVQKNSFASYTEEKCPCLKQIKEYKYKNVLTDKNIEFYLNERCAVYWEYNSKCYNKTFSSINDIDIYCQMRGYTNLKEILLSKYPQKTLSKSEHIQHMKKCDTEYGYLQKTKGIIKKINNSKNGYWNAQLLKDDPSIKINFRINDVFNYHYMYISKSDTKQDIFRRVKMCMNDLLDECKEHKYGSRVMEVNYHN